MNHRWVKYDIEKAQIRYQDFVSVDGVVGVDLKLFEDMLREKGFETQAEFDAKMEKLLKAVQDDKDKHTL